MKFDYTKGQEARYMVSIHRWNADDHYYLHNYRDAKKLFDEIKQKEKDASVNLWDMKKDIRKDYVRV